MQPGRIRALKRGHVTRPARILAALATGDKETRHLARLFGITSAKLGGTLAALEHRGLLSRVRRGLYTLTDQGRKELKARNLTGMVVEQGAPEEPVTESPTPSPEASGAPEESTKREKQPLHWAVKELFDQAEKREIDLASLEALIIEKTGQRISKNTLRFWKGGWSHPKITEVDLIAKALDHELDLMAIGE